MKPARSLPALHRNREVLLFREFTTRSSLRIRTLRRAFNIRYATRYAALFIPSFNTHGEEGTILNGGKTPSIKSTTRLLYVSALETSVVSNPSLPHLLARFVGIE